MGSDTPALQEQLDALEVETLHDGRFLGSRQPPAASRRSGWVARASSVVARAARRSRSRDSSAAQIVRALEVLQEQLDALEVETPLLRLRVSHIDALQEQLDALEVEIAST